MGDYGAFMAGQAQSYQREAKKYRDEAHLLTHERDELQAEVDRHHELIEWMRDSIKFLLAIQHGLVNISDGEAWAKVDAIEERINREVG